MALLMILLGQEDSASIDTLVGVISAVAPIAVAIFTWLQTRSGATGTLKQRRGTPDRPDDAGYAIAHLAADAAPPVAVVTPTQWAMRKWAWGALALALFLMMCLILSMVWMAARDFTTFDMVDYFLALAAGLLCEVGAISALQRFRTMWHTSCNDASGIEQEVSVRGELDVVVQRCEQIIAAMKVAVTSIENDSSKVTLTGVLPSSTEILQVAVANGNAGLVRVNVRSRSTPAGSSYRRNTRNVLRFLEQLAGVRMYQRRGRASWTPASPAEEAPGSSAARTQTADPIALPEVEGADAASRTEF